jgi:predicted O-methyltransferase YrrM
VSGLLARLRSLLTLSDQIAAIGERARGIEARLARIEEDVVALRTVVRTRDDRQKERLKAGLASLANVIALLPELDIKGVLPPLPHQGHTITGQEAAFLFHLVRRHRPRTVLELGSGSSTVLLAAALRANGGGRLVSVEHDAEHLRATSALLRQAELSDRAELILAPLTALQVGGHSFQWYDLAPHLARLGERIDLLLVDGPPGRMQSLARYPALPMLAAHLAPQALIYVDDAAREDEAQMLALWRELDSLAFDSEVLDFLPHAPALLTMKPAASIAALQRGCDEDGEADDSRMRAPCRRSEAS